MPNTVIIIGAGLGGLALAQGLTNAGLAVTVYERDAGPDSRAQGYRISVNEAGSQALSQLLSPRRFAGLSTVDVAGVGEDFTFATAGMRPLYPLNRSGAVQYLGPDGWSLFVSLCEREDRTPTVLWALSRRGRADGVRRDWLAEARSAMRHRAWHRYLRKLIDETPAEAIVEPLTLTMARIPKRPGTPLWPSGRVTLLGDAAHAMPPQRGLGGNTAFVDAWHLVRALQNGTVADYEREMLARGRRAVEESVEAAQMFHFRNPVAVAVRNTALRVARLVRPRRG